MRSRMVQFAAGLALAALAAGCAFSDEVLFKTFTGEEPVEEGTTVGQEHLLGLGIAAPLLRKGRFVPDPVSLDEGTANSATGSATGSEAGRATALLRVDVMDLQTTLRHHNDRLQLLRRSLTVNIGLFREAVATLELKEGDALPANDASFAARSRDMRLRLDRLYADLLKLNGLAAKVNVAAARAAQYLGQSQELMARKDLAPAERRQVDSLEKNIDATVTLALGFLSELHLDIGAQTKYASEQRSRLDAFVRQVAKADPDGPLGAADRDTPTTLSKTTATASSRPGPASGPNAAEGKGQPLIVIRFDKAEVAYAAPLYEAMRAALARRPDARFEIVGVSPAKANGLVTTAAMTRALGVKQTLLGMGLPEARLTLDSMTGAKAEGEEVRVFVRVEGNADAGVTTAPAVTPKQAAVTVIPRPLVTIRFDTERVDYAKPLHDAVKAALERRPGARFELISIATGKADFAAGTTRALERADAVMEILTGMGLPAARVLVEATVRPGPGPDTILIFVR